MELSQNTYLSYWPKLNCGLAKKFVPVYRKLEQTFKPANYMVTFAYKGAGAGKFLLVGHVHS